jgi:hypothetical protein
VLLLTVGATHAAESQAAAARVRRAVRAGRAPWTAPRDSDNSDAADYQNSGNGEVPEWPWNAGRRGRLPSPMLRVATRLFVFFFCVHVLFYCKRFVKNQRLANTREAAKPNVASGDSILCFFFCVLFFFCNRAQCCVWWIVILCFFVCTCIFFASDSSKIHGFQTHTADNISPIYLHH